MTVHAQWLRDLSDATSAPAVDGLIAVRDYVKEGRPPEEVDSMERAARYGADAVFFEAGRDDRPAIAQAFVFRSDGPARDPKFAQVHQRLWSWGGVPLVYRVTKGLVQLFRCAHKADFELNGKLVFKPFKTLKLAGEIAGDSWWDAEQIRNGTLWDDPHVCKTLLSSEKSAQKTLVNAVNDLHVKLNEEKVLPKPLRRRLLILSVLIAYLEARKVFEPDYFAGFRTGAQKFFEVLADGPGLVALLDALETRFNGNVFTLSDDERETLSTSSTQLARFARFVQGRHEPSGQLTLWERYSFADLPVELISHIYQLFVEDSATAVYTPHFLVRLMLSEILGWERLDRLQQNDEIILDPACGSGIFLVEAYKRLVLHWRSRNGWERPKQPVLRKLLRRVHGVDLEQGAVELASFSLCLALCDALEPEEIRASVKLFPELKEKTLHTGCFFEARERGRIPKHVGVVVGNPPFTSSLQTDGSKRACARYQEDYGPLPDKQVAYLFLHESMETLVPGGVLSMLQQYNFLYNQGSLDFRRSFIDRWDLREVLDFVSVRGLFQGGDADTKVVVVVAEAGKSPPNRQILHATFRRSGRIKAQQGFEIDYYDMHWLPRQFVLNNDGVWRAGLLGGGRVSAFVDRLRKLRTLGQYADEEGWDHGEGFVEGASGKSRPAGHIIGKPLLPSKAVTEYGIDTSAIVVAPKKPIEGPRSEKRFTPPMLLIREHMDLFRGIWTKSYLTYKNKLVGFCAWSKDVGSLRLVDAWLTSESVPLRAYVAATSVRLFTQKATTLSGLDIEDLPYPPDRNLRLSPHEQIIAADIVDYYRDLIRLGEESDAMKKSGLIAMPAFNDVFTERINGVYKRTKLRALEPQVWPGVICQPYVFGRGEVDWSGADELQGKLDALVQEKCGGGLNVTRIARLYDGACIYLLKPNRLRYWLRSIALRDADETLADLWQQGF
jgi:hypothetical protein